MSYRDPEGDTGGPDPPWKITSGYRFLRNTGTDPPREAIGPSVKYIDD